MADRFWSKVDRTDGCWIWTAYRTADGYGRLGVAGKVVNAHRFAWELTNGPIPKGMSVLHRCDNPPCVNPDHLFLGTQRDNVRDMVEKGRCQRWHAAVTHCPQGHEYTVENTYVYEGRQRQCRICRCEHQRRFREHRNQSTAVATRG